MIKQTIVRNYQTFDLSHSLKRQLLCHQSDAREICYEISSAGDESPFELIQPSADPAPKAVVAVVPDLVTSAAPTTSIPDVSVTAVDIVKTLVAYTLKKPLAEISVSSTLKALVGGS